MKLQKYEHACFTVEQSGEIIVVDPGAYTNDFLASEHVVAVIVTHMHPDHLDEDQLTHVFAKNPHATLYGPVEVIDNVDTAHKQVVQPGDVMAVGSFSLKFFGGSHQTIHSSIPSVQNIGVLVNELVYYPGDSFAQPPSAVDTLLVPISAPWLKVSDVFDYISEVKPRQCIPTHDAILSETGKTLLDRLVGNHAKTVGSTYRRLDGQPIVLE